MLIHKKAKLTDTHKVVNVLFFSCKSKEPLNKNDSLSEVRECRERERVCFIGCLLEQVPSVVLQSQRLKCVFVCELACVLPL